MNKSTRGFTIVELLIVIVVIAILAAISIVAYNGIQNRTNDTAVKNDLSTLAKKMELYKIDDPSGQYTYGGAYNIPSTLNMKPSKSSYETTGPYSLLNCTTASHTEYAVLAVSKSGKKFYISSLSGGVKEDTTAANFHDTPACPGVLTGSTGAGAAYYNSSWAW